MSLGVGLMGFGRIGRNVFRILYDEDDVRIRGISDVANARAMEYLLRFDTIQGRFPDEVSVTEGHLYVLGRQIPVLHAAEPGEVPWGDLGVDVVVEATGKSLTRAQVERHLEQGAKRVVLCAPPAEPPDLTVVGGVNSGQLGPEHRIVSNASCTAQCIAPVIEILRGAFGVERVFLTTVHAYTNKQRLADVPAEDPRRGRAAAANIIPQPTNTSDVICELLPQLRGKISCMAMNVPVPDGSAVDLVCWHEKKVDVMAVNEVVRTAAASSRWRRILDFETEPVVSSDVVRTPFSGTFDSLATMTLGERVSKTLTWFDNGWGYAFRAVDLIRRMAELEEAA